MVVVVGELWEDGGEILGVFMPGGNVTDHNYYFLTPRQEKEKGEESHFSQQDSTLNSKRNNISPRAGHYAVK